jgi:hypothetical protein
MTGIAPDSKLGRASLYKALSPWGNSRLAAVARVLRLLGCGFSFRAIDLKEIISMRRPKKAAAPAPAAESQPLETEPLSDARLERAAALLDEIDRLGNELWAVMDGGNAYHGVTTPIGRVLAFVEEGLGVDPETHVTPGELARRLRALIPPK